MLWRQRQFYVETEIVLHFSVPVKKLHNSKHLLEIELKLGTLINGNLNHNPFRFQDFLIVISSRDSRAAVTMATLVVDSELHSSTGLKLNETNAGNIRVLIKMNCSTKVKNLNLVDSVAFSNVKIVDKLMFLECLPEGNFSFREGDGVRSTAQWVSIWMLCRPPLPTASLP